MPNISQELIIAAAPAVVYEAITSQQGLRAWWTPGASTTGAANSIARFGFGDHYFKEMTITHLVPLQLVQWHCDAGATEWIGTDISFALRAGTRDSLLNDRPEILGQLEQQEGNGTMTLLVFHHNNWQTYSPMFAECSFTWARFLWGLKLLCETGTGLPWPTQHSVNQ